MAEGNRNEQNNRPRNITGSYPGVTGVYKPHSAYPDAKPQREYEDRRPTKIADEHGREVKEKTGFDFKEWFSKENTKEFLKKLRYYGLIVVASLLLTFCICNFANDVFALAKKDETKIVSIEEGSSTSKIARALKKNGIIEHPLLFQIYSKLKHADGKYQFGSYTLSSAYTYDQIISALKKTSVQAETVSVKIDEGMTQDDIVALLVDGGYAEEDALLQAMNESEYKDYSFVKDLPERRCRLEGYLPSGEYEFYVGESATSMVGKMLQKFQETVLTDENKEKIKSSGYSLDEIITIASLVQGECDMPVYYTGVSAVILNRLKTEGLLQLSSTINYVLEIKKTVLTDSDKLTESTYNTYMYAGLPTGPINNPSHDAIMAVLMPDNSDCTYFVGDTSHVYFASTVQEHQANLQKVAVTAKGTDAIR